jgi:hypothetical protein
MARFSPPGGLGDLTRDDDLQAWSDAVSALLDARIPEGGQLFNPVTTPRGDLQPRRVPWIAMPQTVWDHQPREAAREHVDDPANRPDAGMGQNEYAEWFTHRDPDGEVVGVDLTTELPDYWRFLGERLSPTELGDVYRQLYPDAADADLRGADGSYDPGNPWNTTRGAMHLIGQINTLAPDALGVVGGSVPWRFLAPGQVVDVQDCGLGVFHADPSIVANLNRIAREGRAITLQDPIGVYIIDLDTTGWETPDGSDPADLVTFSRGTPPMHARVAVPPGRGFRLCDVRIAGERIRWGSQIAERTVVGITAAVGPPGEFTFADGTRCAGAGPVIADADVGASDEAAAVAVVVDAILVTGRSVR